MQTQSALPEVQYDAYGEALKSVGKETVVLYTTPDCAECKNAEEQILRLAEKFPGLNFVKIDGNVRYRPDQLPVLDVVTTELLWVYTKQRYDWNDAKLTAFLSEREMYTTKSTLCLARNSPPRRASPRQSPRIQGSLNLDGKNCVME